MIYYIMYTLIISELFFSSLFYIVQWKQYKRRKSDMYTSIVFLILGVSYIFYVSSFVNNTKLIQLVMDFILAIVLGIAFYNKVRDQWKMMHR